MFGRRRKERERRAQIESAVFAHMDEREAESWAWRELADEFGEEAASEKYPRQGVVEIVESLLPLSNNEVGDLMVVLEAWHESRKTQFDETGHDDRAMHVSGIHMSVVLIGIGNLFGFVPNEAPALIRS